LASRYAENAAGTLNVVFAFLPQQWRH
jgi:hypothetical protein